jgi:predicted RNA binding protein with dsRBD fold (UPF0201 family)
MYTQTIADIMDDVEHAIKIKVRKQVAYHNFMEVFELKHIDQLLDCEFHIREQFMEDAENES